MRRPSQSAYSRGRMNIDIYSDRAKQAIQSAQSLALARRHQHLAPEHILKVLLEERDGLTRALAEAEQGAKTAGDAFVTTERLLIALAKEGGEAAKVLKDAGVTAKGLEEAATAVRKGRTAVSASAEE